MTVTMVGLAAVGVLLMCVTAAVLMAVHALKEWHALCARTKERKERQAMARHTERVRRELQNFMSYDGSEQE